MSKYPQLPSCPGLPTEQLLSLTDSYFPDESKLPRPLQSFVVSHMLMTSGTQNIYPYKL